MQKVISFFIMAISIAVLSPLHSQTSEENLQINPKTAGLPFYWFMREDKVKKNEEELYQSKLKTLIHDLKNQKNFYRVISFLEKPTNTFYYLYPFNTDCSWKEIYDSWSNYSGKLEVNSSLVSSSLAIAKTRSDLSKIPATNFVTLRDPNFLHTETFEVIPGAEQKFIAVFNDWKKEVEAKAPNCGWIMLEILVGGPKTTFQLLWGDCLSQNKIKPLDTYLIEKSAIGSIVRKLSSEDRSFLPNLSTSALDMAKIEIKK